MATTRIWGYSLRSSREPRDKKWWRELLCITSLFFRASMGVCCLAAPWSPCGFCVWVRKGPASSASHPVFPVCAPLGAPLPELPACFGAVLGSQRPAGLRPLALTLPVSEEPHPGGGGRCPPTPSALPHFQPQTLSSLAPMLALEVKFQHLQEVPVSPRALASVPSVVHVVMATQAQDPRDGRAELMAVPDKGFLSWRG